jgi:hypothetical protein
MLRSKRRADEPQLADPPEEQDSARSRWEGLAGFEDQHAALGVAVEPAFQTSIVTAPEAQLEVWVHDLAEQGVHRKIALRDEPQHAASALDPLDAVDKGAHESDGLAADPLDGIVLVIAWVESHGNHGVRAASMVVNRSGSVKRTGAALGAMWRMSAMSTIHVLLPVRDARETLAAAMGDVLSQRGVELVLWLIDDHSSDGSRRVAEDVAASDPRVRILDAEGTGVAAALETGRLAAMSAGAEWIGRMDADDRCPPHRLARLARTLHCRGLDALASAVEPFCDEGPISDAMLRYLRWQNRLRQHAAMAVERFVDVPLSEPSTLFRAVALERAGGWQTTPWIQDLDLWLRFFDSGLRAGKLAEPLYRWRIHSGQLTRTSRACSSPRMRRGRARYLATLLHREGQVRVQVVGTGRSVQRWARALASEQPSFDLRTVVWDPPEGVDFQRPGPPPLEPGRVCVAVMSSERVRKAYRKLLPSWAAAEGSRLWFVS